MKIKNILSYSLLLFCILGCSGKHLREYYKNGKIKRELITTDTSIRCLYYYENGKLEGKGELLADGNRTGNWVYYYENGREKAQGNYSDGLKEGNWRYHIGDSSFEISWNAYINRPVKINVPNNWVLKEGIAPNIPLAGFNDSSQWSANFNVVLIDRKSKALDSIINETIKMGRERLSYDITILSIKDIEINKITGKAVTQRILAENKRFIVTQYFLEQPDFVYQLSCFVYEDKQAVYDGLLKEIAFSFFII